MQCTPFPSGVNIKGLRGAAKLVVKDNSFPVLL